MNTSTHSTGKITKSRYNIFDVNKDKEIWTNNTIHSFLYPVCELPAATCIIGPMVFYHGCFLQFTACACPTCTSMQCILCIGKKFSAWALWAALMSWRYSGLQIEYYLLHYKEIYKQIQLYCISKHIVSLNSIHPSVYPVVVVSPYMERPSVSNTISIRWSKSVISWSVTSACTSARNGWLGVGCRPSLR